MAKGKKVGLGKAWPEDKRKGKEAKTQPETQGPEVAPKAKETAPKAADLHVSQPTSKEDPPFLPRFSLGFCFLFFFFLFCTFSFVMAVFHCS